MAPASICSSREDAEDLASQAIETHLLKSWPSWEPDKCSYATVVNRAACHTIGRAMRRLMAKDRYLAAWASPGAVIPQQTRGHILSDVRHILDADKEALDVFEISYVAGHTVAETAWILGISRGKVERARKRIRLIVGDSGLFGQYLSGGIDQ